VLAQPKDCRRIQEGCIEPDEPKDVLHVLHRTAPHSNRY
jgi:hypothetical protein